MLDTLPIIIRREVAQVVDPTDLNDHMQQLHEERIAALRRRSAELTDACLSMIPFWYKWWIQRQGRLPQRAAENLMGLSNTRDYEVESKRVDKIKHDLAISTDVI